MAREVVHAKAEAEAELARKEAQAAHEQQMAEMLSDVANGTTEKAEIRNLRAATAAAQKATRAARKETEAATAVAKEASTAREAETEIRLATQHELERLQTAQEQMVEAAAAAFDSAPSPESLPSVAGIGDHGYDTKPALKLGYNSVAVQNLSEPSASPSASPGCPTQCLDRSVPWWYRKECQACQGVLGNELTWTCPPTWPPQKLFIIFSMQRSATQTACYTVGSLPDTACVGELFNQGLFPRNITDPEQMLRDTFAARRSASGLAPCTWGFRLLYQDGLQHPQLLGWLWDILDASIILERSNGALCTCPFCY